MSAVKPTAAPRLSELASQIASQAAILEKFLDDNGLPQPSFGPEGPSVFPVNPEQEEAHTARFALIDAAKELHDLVVGPSDMLKWMVLNDHNLNASLHAVHQFKIAQAVPLDGEISFADLGRATGLSELNVARIVRMVITGRIFIEHRVGFVSHSASSRLLATDKGMQAIVGHMIDEAFPSSAKLVECLEKFNGSEEPQHSPFALVFGAPMFGYFAQHPEKMQQFGECMTSWAAGDGEGHMVKGYDWNSVGDGLVVDVGGSVGHISLALASAYPSLSFQIQDMPHLSSGASALISSRDQANTALQLSSRVTFSGHDFFTPQPASAVNASVYLLRYILHDWSDTYARRILTQIAAAMKPNHSRLIIADAVLPPPGPTPDGKGRLIPLAQETQLRAFDVSMFVQLNARERALGDWQSLLTSVDPRLRVVDVKPPPPGSSCSIIDVRLVE